MYLSPVHHETSRNAISDAFGIIFVHGRVVESMAACRVGVNAFCMILLVGAEAEGDSVHAERMETAVGCFELILLIGRKYKTGSFQSVRLHFVL